MFGFFKKFGKPKSKIDEVETQIILGMLKVMAVLGERVSSRALKGASKKLCQDWLPYLPEHAITNCLPEALAAFVLVAQSQISVANKNLKYAAVLISAAKFCVADAVESVGFDDLSVMRAAAKIAQDNGLEFYSSMLETA